MYASLEALKQAYLVGNGETKAISIDQRMLRDGTVRVTLRDNGHSLMEQEFNGGDEVSSLFGARERVLGVERADAFVNQARRMLWLS